ncbi:hypothetical protein P6709_03445 [Jeotgalibacillus sp. ET6]|uniref:hypothetical protein n=1 Tax=Jeotgalibacillus sp. ET6 TaxID=3037260 RepID=UPI0024181E80|nr:hypothetical protein [Jeotgalibacillus sp. ET6]MDG5470789.1 hypothetical protein [Jeotgalibacillus sp. ET6]
MKSKEKAGLWAIIDGQSGSLMLPAILLFSTVLFIGGGISATCISQISHYEKISGYYKKEAMLELNKVKRIRSVESRTTAQIR